MPIGKPRINAPVFGKLHKGINMDTALPSIGVWPKIQHDVAQFQAAADAGFETVRVFLPFRSDIKIIEEQIDDALSNNLAIVVCMWGSREWSKNPDLGEQQIADKWRELGSVAETCTRAANPIRPSPTPCGAIRTVRLQPAQHGGECDLPIQDDHGSRHEESMHKRATRGGTAML